MDKEYLIQQGFTLAVMLVSMAAGYWVGVHG